MNMEIIVGVQNGGPEERKGRGGSRRSDNNKLKKKPEETRTCRLTNLLAKPRFTTTTPLYHLQGRYAPRYRDQDQQKTKDADLFDLSLELMNRRGVQDTLKPLENNNSTTTTTTTTTTTQLAQYFFEKVGEVSVAMKLCVQCRDVGKNKKKLDQYFIDLMEITTSDDRTILCSKCMSDLVKLNVRNSNNRDEVIKQLDILRNQQPDGVVVDPFLITCGY